MRIRARYLPSNTKRRSPKSGCVKFGFVCCPIPPLGRGCSLRSQSLRHPSPHHRREPPPRTLRWLNQPAYRTAHHHCRRRLGPHHGPSSPLNVVLRPSDRLDMQNRAACDTAARTGLPASLPGAKHTRYAAFLSPTPQTLTDSTCSALSRERSRRPTAPHLPFDSIEQSARGAHHDV